jgi:hypothetical protein
MVALEMTWRRARATASVALGTLAVSWFISACNSPTLPVPPPADPLMVPNAVLEADGEHVTLSGTQAWPGALVIVVNHTLLASNPAEAIRGTRVDVDGSYLATIRVDLRCTHTNSMEIWQRNDEGFESKPKPFQAPVASGDAGLTNGGSVCTDAGLPSEAEAAEAGDTHDGGQPTVDGAGE